jgi:hypothetical protein
MIISFQSKVWVHQKGDFTRLQKTATSTEIDFFSFPRNEYKKYHMHMQKYC